MQTSSQLIIQGCVALFALLFMAAAGRAQVPIPSFTNPNSSLEYPLGATPNWLVVADFNNDGKADIATSNTNDTFSILLGNGDGTFKNPITYTSGVGENCGIATGDLNGDGKIDLIATSCDFSSDHLNILLGNGDGTFQAQTNAGVPAGWMKIADFNRDGKADLVLLRADDTLAVLLGKGDGTFYSPVYYQVPEEPNSPCLPPNPSCIPSDLATGDLNGDGKLDLIVANKYNTISVFLGNGDGSFQPGVNYDVHAGAFAGSNPIGLALGDFDSDGKLDVAVDTRDYIVVLWGNGTGGFREFDAPGAGNSFGLPLDMPSEYLAVADFNGDGTADISAATLFGGEYLLLGSVDSTIYEAVNPNGPGGGPLPNFLIPCADPTGCDFFPIGTIPTPNENNGPDWPAVGDFNGDGKPDIAAANVHRNSVWIYLNTTPFLNTAAGAGVGAHPVDTTTGTNPITLTFSSVAQAGMTTLTTSNAGATPPTGFQLGSPATYYDLHTNATFSGTVSLCINYASASFANQSAPRLLHYENNVWADITSEVDTVHKTICGNTSSFSPFIVAQPVYAAQVQEPINADGSSVFNAKKGVVPVKFNLTLGNVSTCQLPTASIALTRTSGNSPGVIDESVYEMPSDNGAYFRISDCQYVYNLSAKSLAAGTYRANIFIGGQIVGSGFFGLK
jgi:hypothetical protein